MLFGRTLEVVNLPNYSFIAILTKHRFKLIEKCTCGSMLFYICTQAYTIPITVTLYPIRLRVTLFTTLYPRLFLHFTFTLNLYPLPIILHFIFILHRISVKSHCDFKIKSNRFSILGMYIRYVFIAWFKARVTGANCFQKFRTCRQLRTFESVWLEQRHNIMESVSFRVTVCGLPFSGLGKEQSERKIKK